MKNSIFTPGNHPKQGQLSNKRTCLWMLFISLFTISKGFAQPFITTWKTDNPGSSGPTSITIPTTGTGYNYDVDWDNDGIFDEFGITGSVTHDYGVAGIVTIRIRGAFPRIYFPTSGDKEKILTIEQWGSIAWTSMAGAFSWASNLTYNASDSPDLSAVTDMSRMFSSASAFNGDLSAWDVSKVTDMSNMFRSARAFNGDLSTWDVGSVTDMSSMFNGASAFNGDLSAWDVSKVTDMSWMFFFASAFNGDLSAWDVGSVTDMSIMFNGARVFNGDLSTWDVSSVTDMAGMFWGASVFNGDLSAWDVSSVTDMSSMFSSISVFNGDLSAWNVSKVTDMSWMFFFARDFNSDLTNWDVSNVTNMFAMFSVASTFDQDLGGWDISSVSNMRSMLNSSGLSVDNYDNTLIGWESQGVANLSLGASSLEYCAGESARNSLIDIYGWTITGDSPICSPLPVEWISFDASLLENGEVKLDWQTASEINNSGYEIHKSNDSENWEMIGFVEAKAMTHENSAYEFMDRTPFLGVNYYRLKQIDFDGVFQFSSIVSVTSTEAEIQVELYPNPSPREMNISIHNPSRESMRIVLSDALGRKIWKSEIIEKNASWKKIFQLEQSGLYFISVRSGQRVITKKLVIY